MALMDQAQKQHHVLMVAFASQGHMNPMLRLGMKLFSKGIIVKLATTEIARHRMLKYSSAAADSTSGIELLYYSDGLSIDFDRRTHLDGYMESLAKFGSPNLSNLIKQRYGNPGSADLLCIVANPFVPWVADVAAEHGVPCALLWIQPCALYAIYYRFYNKLNFFQILTCPGMRLELPGLPSLGMQDLPSFVLPNDPFGSIEKLLYEAFQALSMNKFKWVLANSFYELERDVIDSMSELYAIRPVGPLVPPLLPGQDREDDVGIGMWRSDERCIEWLDRQRHSSVIYVSFGSILALPAELMENIATGLKNAKHPFLWVVKPPEWSSKDGEGQLPQGFLDETKEQGLVVPWCPQPRVLSHPAIACFVTHCGWNSILETVCSGVPLIAYPQWTDQPTNAKLIEDVFKIGVRLRSDRKLGKCIEDILASPQSEELRNNAAALKEVARKVVGHGGSSDRNVQLFVDELIQNASV
uniref:Glycosyltransferase n=1 Tax=Eucalyptus camaldulensis TaxID=34316 RepID=A0A2Z5V9C2_EUCCA|nr:UDP-glycosyltransferase superfamily protein [Eucalyptus camaldulensis]